MSNLPVLVLPTMTTPNPPQTVTLTGDSGPTPTPTRAPTGTEVVLRGLSYADELFEFEFAKEG